MIFIGHGSYGVVFSFKNRAYKVHKSKLLRNLEAWFSQQSKNHPTILQSVIITDVPYNITSSPVYDATLKEAFLRYYSTADALFVASQLKAAFIHLSSCKIVHTDCSPTNVLVNFNLIRKMPHSYYSSPININIKQVVLADFSSAIHITHEIHSKKNVTFPNENTVCFYGKNTTLWVRPPEFYSPISTFSKLDVYKIDSWSFGVLCALTLYYKENKKGQYNNLIFGLSEDSKVDVLWNHIDQLKREIADYKAVFCKYLQPKERRSIITL